jgi:Integrase zinc binding domain
MNTADAETRVLFSQRQTLEVKDGILYRQFVRPDGTVSHLQTVVPYTLRQKYMRCIHGAKLTGHLGYNKSRHRLLNIAYWPGWTRDLRLFLQCCVECNQARKGPCERHAPLKHANTTAVFHRVHVDLMGPFVKSRSGFTYISTAICSFSKYLITIPFRNKSSFSVARELVRKVYLLFGACELSVYDGGLEFCNELAKEINELLEIRGVTTTPYRPSGNGQI